MNGIDSSMGSQPMSAKELSEKAKEFDWNPRVGFKYWARAAETIHHEVRPALQAQGLHTG
jgi:STAM-binding protein